jgi:uncharacterized protein DUF4340
MDGPKKRQREARASIMSEMAKTMSFVAVAVVALALAWVSRPAPAVLDVNSRVGEDLTKGFTDAGEAKRLRIVQFDEASATLRDFEVAEENGLWKIPSKNGYPADAEKQMAEAATTLMDRKILSVASDNPGDHEQFGVIDPLSPKLEVGQKGVGTRVTVSNIQNEALADLIVGHEVKEAKNEQHYVREAGRDAVYVVELKSDRLTTHFEDWIEKDLLKLNPWDIQQVELKDYSAELVPAMTDQGLVIQVAWDPRSELTLGYNEKEAKWTPIDLKKFDEKTKKYNEFKLGDNEELNTQKLNAMKTALDDLKIVDVSKKPSGLSADLKAGGDFLSNSEARQDLRSRGFAAIPSRTGEGQEIISSDGEVICTMNDGVEYVLRFGNLKMAAGNGDKDAADPTNPAAAANDKSHTSDKDVQRYLFAMARFNEDAVKKPELTELPKAPEGFDEKSLAGEKDKDAKSSDASKDEKADGDKKDDAKSEEAAKDEKPADDAAKDDEKSEELKKYIAERKLIEAENQKKLDEYQAKLDKGRQTVKDLNLRFGDWYFVVPNDVFQKVRLGRDDVVKSKDQKDDKAAAGAAMVNPFAKPGQAIPGMPKVGGGK